MSTLKHTFKLPEEAVDARIHLKAPQLLRCLDDFATEIAEVLDNDCGKLKAKEREVWEKVQDKFYNILKEYGINIMELNSDDSYL